VIKKLLKLIKNRRGATLVELMVGMIIAAIVMGAASTIMAPMLRVFMHAGELSETNKLLDTVAALIIDDINRAETPTSINGNVITITTNVEVFEYYIDPTDNILMRRTVDRDTGNPVPNTNFPVFAEDFYRHKGLGVTYNTPNVDVSNNINGPFEFTLTIIGRDGPMTSRTYAVNPMGLR